MSYDYSVTNNQLANNQLEQTQEASQRAFGRSGKALSFLEVIASIMGAQQGELIGKMLQKLEQVRGLTDNITTSEGPGAAAINQKQAQDFQIAMSEYQALVQMFSTMTNAHSNSLKTIGEALTGLARKSG